MRGPNLGRMIAERCVSMPRTQRIDIVPAPTEEGARIGRVQVVRLGAGFLLGILALVAGACGPDSGGVTPPAIPPPSPPILLPDGQDTVFLQVERSAGFVLIEYSIGQPPLHRLTVGGDLYYEGPTPEIFPGPLLPNLRRARLSEAAFREVLLAISATALAETDDEQILEYASIIADAPHTTFIFTDRAGEHRLGVYALLAGRFADPRVAPLVRLLETLGRVAERADHESWRGERLQVWALRSEPFPEPDLATVEPWPLSAPPAPAERVDCRVLEGEEASRLHRLFAGANHGYRWEHEESLYQLVPRALFPGEAGCAGASPGANP